MCYHVIHSRGDEPRYTAQRMQLLKVRNAAERLGIAEVTLRKWIAERKVEVVRLTARAVRVSQAEIERLVADATIPTHPN